MSDIDKVTWAGTMDREWEVLVEGRWIRVRGKTLYDALYCHEVRGWQGECAAYLLACSRVGVDGADLEFEIMTSDIEFKGKKTYESVVEMTFLNPGVDIRLNKASCWKCGYMSSKVLISQCCAYTFCWECCRDSGMRWPCCWSDMTSVECLKLSTME